MKLKVCWIGKTKEDAARALTEEYLKRLGRYLPTEGLELRQESALLELAAVEARKDRTRPVLVVLEAGGRQMTSEALAEFLRRQQDGGTQTLIFAVGPADGWSEAARKQISTLPGARILSLGKMTFAHEIARIVLLEQIYRALTILGGHPYHRGH